MSLFDALGTAVSGLTAQSAAFTNISDNVANSQTVGFKGVDTTFIDYLTHSTATENQSGSVATRPDYTNGVQGTIQQSTDQLAMAIAGQGFFAVAEGNGTTATGGPTFDAQQYYTRAGDFRLDRNGYLVNGSGAYLKGWMADPLGNLDQSKLQTIQVPQSQFAPTATSNIVVAANLPAGGTAPQSAQVQVYDAIGNAHTISLGFAPTATANDWTTTVSVDGATVGTADTTFGTGTSAAVPPGTLNSVTATSGTVASSVNAQGQAVLTIPQPFGVGSAPLAITLGTVGKADGLTQFAGSTYSLRSITQDGTASGAYTGMAIKSNGDIVANYDNGQSRLIAHVPLLTFENPNALQRQNGQAFTVTADSGQAVTKNANSDGAGAIVTGSVESSNVDIATEFTKLIVAQQAYGANTKVVTTASDLLQETIDMKR